MPSRTLFDPHQAIKIKGFGGKMGHLVLTNLLVSERCCCCAWEYTVGHFTSSIYYFMSA